ncbi:MAG TPA: hypothetical protein VJ953_16515 [Saprospiraceae bacterium]|nr:hypothetical protein [Saprospiraceae bacterium]
MSTPKLHLLTLVCTALFGAAAHAQTNYDESKVPDYELPELLRTQQGKAIATTADWESTVRPELLRLFTEQVYGQMPEAISALDFEVFDEEVALDGRAIRKQVRLRFSRNGQSHEVSLLIYLPAAAEKPVPLFLGLNFYGNHTIHADPNIAISEAWVPNNNRFCISGNRADEVSRGVRSYRWPVERLLARGYGLATVYCGDIDPDFDDGFENGVHSLFQGDEAEKAKWSTISAWAWGLSGAMNYLEEDAQVDGQRVAVIGHSRLGKAALWAGATDERFALVVSNDSGCGGAALSRRRFGETLKDINGNFPHWFCDNFKQYNGREDDLPVDQHQLLALVAPRPLYVASAQQDEWADPRGEYLSLYHAAAVYQLYEHEAVLNRMSPAVNTPVYAAQLGYHIRTGTHDITRYDWERYMDFADRAFE